MGYAVGSLIHLSKILRSTNTAVKRVIDLGSQDVTIFDNSDLANVRQFLANCGAHPDSLRARFSGSFPDLISAQEIFSAAGFDYVCCDVDRRQGTWYIDFNTLAFDQSLYGQFDLILNAGTTEHLPNPLAAFFLMHYLCRKGGLIYNEVPLSGWFNHGLNNLTPKFWHTLRWMNSYQVVSAIIKKVQLSLADDGNFGGQHLDFIQNLNDLDQVSASIQIIFRKTEVRGFIPPFDAVIPTNDGGKAVAELVLASLMPFVVCGSLSQRDAVESVNAFLSMQQLCYRIWSSVENNALAGRQLGSWTAKTRQAAVRRFPFLRRVKSFFRHN